MISRRDIPAGWVELADGSFARPDVAKRLCTPAVRVPDAVEKERDLHLAILAECKRRGWPVVHSRMDVPATAGVGTPDFVIALPEGRTLWIEAKAKNGKLRPEQQAWLTALRAVGHSAHVVRSMREFLEVM